jgi:hypothetical protein
MAGKDIKTMKFSRKDLTRRREGAEDAKEEKEKGFKKPQNPKLSYPKTHTYNDKHTNNNSVPLCLRESFLFILIFTLISCRTTPNIPSPVSDNTNVLPLERGASIYVMADVIKARPILERLPIRELNDSMTRQLLERTNYAVVALFPQDSGRRFQLAAWGNYPASQADLVLSFNKSWEKMKSQAGGSYWYSSAGWLSLALSSGQAFIAASFNDEPFDPFTTADGVEIPDGFAEFRRNADGASSPFSCWLENPNAAISGIMNTLGLPLRFPVQKLFINLLPIQEEKYETLIRLQFENASYARAVAAILSLASGFSSGDSDMALASVFLANPPVLNGSYVDIKSAALTESNIGSIFSLFF